MALLALVIVRDPRATLPPTPNRPNTPTISPNRPTTPPPPPKPTGCPILVAVFPLSLSAVAVFLAIGCWKKPTALTSPSPLAGEVPRASGAEGGGRRAAPGDTATGDAPALGGAARRPRPPKSRLSPDSPQPWGREFSLPASPDSPPGLGGESFGAARGSARNRFAFGEALGHHPTGLGAFAEELGQVLPPSGCAGPRGRPFSQSKHHRVDEAAVLVFLQDDAPPPRAILQAFSSSWNTSNLRFLAQHRHHVAGDRVADDGPGPALGPLPRVEHLLAGAGLGGVRRASLTRKNRGRSSLATISRPSGSCRRRATNSRPRNRARSSAGLGLAPRACGRAARACPRPGCRNRPSVGEHQQLVGCFGAVEDEPLLVAFL